jgi:hypothetical protein
MPPGFIPHAFNWLVVICYFFVGVSRGSPPAFVWAIIFILFFLDLTFAVNQYYQQMVRGMCCFLVSRFAAFVFARFAYSPSRCCARMLMACFRCLLDVSLTAQEKGKWADYLHGEYVFCVLSLVAKQLLAWLNFGGAKALR